MSARPRFRLAGHLDVDLPPEKAFPLFTAQGETLWVPDWSPEYPACDDAGDVGSVWRTRADGRETTWIVVASQAPFSAAYARMTPGHSATTVRVRLERVPTGSRVHVGYDLTSLDEAADAPLERFADDFDAMLGEWQRLIAAALPAIQAG